MIDPLQKIQPNIQPYPPVTTPERIRKAIVDPETKDMTDPEWLRDLSGAKNSWYLPFEVDRLRLIADRLETLEKRWAEVVELLEHAKHWACRCHPAFPDIWCEGCTAKRLLADAPKETT